MAKPTAEELLAALEDSIEDLDTTKIKAKVMIYGESGVGKTVEAVTLAQTINPTGKSILYIDAVEGWVSLRNHKGLTNNVRRMVYRGVSQLDILASAIEARKAPFDKIGTVIFDELSTMSKKDLDIVLAGRAKNDPTKDPDVPTQPDFFANTERMRRLVMKMLPLDCNIIIVAHNRTDKNQKTGVETIGPAFMPKFSETLRENLHLVGHMTADERILDEETVYIRKIQVHPSRTVIAKSRVGGLSIHNDPNELNGAVLEWMVGAREEEVEEREPVTIDEEISAEEDDPALVVD